MKVEQTCIITKFYISNIDCYLSIILQFNGNTALVFKDEGFRTAVSELQDEREVSIDMVMCQYVAARTREGQVATIECEDVLTVDDYTTHCEYK